MKKLINILKLEIPLMFGGLLIAGGINLFHIYYNVQNAKFSCIWVGYLLIASGLTIALKKVIKG